MYVSVANRLEKYWWVIEMWLNVIITFAFGNFTAISNANTKRK